MADYASNDIREAMSRISQLLDSDDSATHSDEILFDIEPEVTPPPRSHKHPNLSISKTFDSFNEDFSTLDVIPTDLTKTMSSKKFSLTTLSRMSRFANKTQEKLQKLRLTKEAKEVEENQKAPVISEKSKKMVSTRGSIYERSLKQVEERTKELENKKAASLAKKSELEGAELKFTPQILGPKSQKKRDAEGVNKALYLWQKEKQSKRKLKQELKQKKELEGATFKPELTQRTNKLASRRYKEKKPVDMRLYEGAKHHEEVIKKSQIKFTPKFQPDLSDTKGHKSKLKHTGDVFGRLYRSAADLSEMLIAYSSNAKASSPQAVSPRAMKSYGEITSTGSLLKTVMTGKTQPVQATRPRSARTISPKKPASTAQKAPMTARKPDKEPVIESSLGFAYYESDEQSEETPFALSSLIGGPESPEPSDSSAEVIPELPGQEESEEATTVDSLLASLSSLTMSYKS